MALVPTHSDAHTKIRVSVVLRANVGSNLVKVEKNLQVAQV